MEFIGILTNQIMIMFILIFAGAILFRCGKLTAAGSKDLGNVLLYFIIPCVIINSFMTDFTWEKLTGLGISFLLAFLALLLSLVVSALVFKKHPIENFSATFSNAGFMGIPIIQATLGDDAVFYAAAFVALLNLFQWTYGVYVITGDRSLISLKKIATNPIVISLLIGLALFFLPIEIPSIVESAVSMVSSANSPVAMLMIGTYLAQIPLKDMFTDKIVWLCSIVRLVLVPVLTMLLLWFVPEQYATIQLVVMIEAVAPVGANVAIAAQLYNRDYTQAVKDVCLSTILSLISMPAMIALAQFIW